jgi:hypothetical protein
MKKHLFLLLLPLVLSADIKQDLFSMYQNGDYKKACSVGIRYVHQFNQDEQFVSLYAFSCLKSDYIDRLAVPISMLKHTAEARANSAYFSVILMQKKLLYHAMIDGYNISGLKLPSTDYVLSKVFDLYANRNNQNNDSSYMFTDPVDEKRSYKLYVEANTRIKKIVIEEYYDTIMTNRHTYW